MAPVSRKRPVQLRLGGLDRGADIAHAVARKLARFESRSHRPRVLDLFAGCGGMTLGFVRAGCESVGGVEIDPDATATYGHNFHRLPDGSVDQRHTRPTDIEKVNAPSLLESWGFSEHQMAVDVLIGGPPCPAFARIGRAKLREIRNHPEAFRLDPRARLYLRYLDYVADLAPVALVMENVPDVLNFGGHNLAEEICDSLEALGYECTYTLLNAASYGVPQMRERFFLVAVHREAASAFEFPEATCAVQFPRGYTGTRQVALQDLDRARRFVPTPGPAAAATPPITARDALADLPKITGHRDGTLKRGARRFSEGVSYERDLVPGAYARMMRSWPGFKSTGQIYDHVIRSLSDRDYDIFEVMKPGDQYPEAHRIATQSFERALRRLSPRPTAGSAKYRELLKAKVPPYDPGKFPNKWRKMEADQPARTLMAHLGKDSYSHIHYDSEQARTISVREAARLQSIPDGFTFVGTMNPAFRMIGNSVPPLLAFAIARQLMHALGITRKKTSDAERVARTG